MAEKKKKYSIDLAGQMAECEANYARIMRLLPNMAIEDQRQFTVRLKGQSPVQFCLDVIERCKYTTMIEIRQLSSGSPKWVNTPHFSLRVYHDAQMAEVIGFNNHKRLLPKYQYPNKEMYQQDEKAQLNTFLGEWLSYCLQYGQAVDKTVIYSS